MEFSNFDASSSRNLLLKLIQDGGTFISYTKESTNLFKRYNRLSRDIVTFNVDGNGLKRKHVTI